MRFEPQRASLRCRINSNFLPPLGFVTMLSAQGDGEFVADLASESPNLSESQMVGIAGDIGRKPDKAARPN